MLLELSFSQFLIWSLWPYSHPSDQNFAKNDLEFLVILVEIITRSLSNIEESLFSIMISLIFGRDFSLLALVHKC